MSTQRVIFYSWQSDLPNTVNRGFIRKALEDASKTIGVEDSLEDAPRVDSDTAGVPGAPDIAATIFEKIDAAAVFVADVTPVAKTADGKLCPNPNVLIELGYASRSLTWRRVIFVNNEFFGPIEGLPFDLSRHRGIPYSADPDAEPDERRTARQKLASVLAGRLRECFAGIAVPLSATPIELALSAIDDSRGNRDSLVRQAAVNISERLADSTTNLHVPELEIANFLASLDKAWPAIADFTALASKAAEHNDRESCLGLFEVISTAAQGLMTGGSGRSFPHGNDYWRFVTLELQLILIAALLRENRLELAGEVARLPCVVLADHEYRPLTLSERSEAVHRLVQRRKELPSPVGQYLSERYAPGTPAAATMALADLIDGDLFLLISSTQDVGPFGNDSDWTAWTLPYVSRVPKFLRNTVSTEWAERLATALKLSPEELKERSRTFVAAGARVLGGFGSRNVSPVLLGWDPNSIGTVP